MIRLHTAGRNQRVGVFRARLRRDQRELAHLVASESERDRVVPFDEETWTAAEARRETRQRFDGCRRREKRQRRKARECGAELGGSHGAVYYV